MCPEGYKGEARAKFGAKSIPGKLSAGTSLFGKFWLLPGSVFAHDCYRCLQVTFSNLIACVIVLLLLYIHIYFPLIFIHVRNSQYLLLELIYLVL